MNVKFLYQLRMGTIFIQKKRKMQMKRTNLEERLNALRTKDKSVDILDQVATILREDDAKDDLIQKTIASNNGNTIDNKFSFDLLETKNIYHISQIKKICVDYRLRFLDSKYFKGELPYEAISKIKELENIHDIKIEGFKIVAPAKLFKLENYDDPLLFAPIANGYYYLIHKWGNDLSPHRRWQMWSFKNFENFLFLLFLMSLVITGLIPDGLFLSSPTAENAGLIFLFVFKFVVAIAFYYGFVSGKNFSSSIWNSKYYNK